MKMYKLHNNIGLIRGHALLQIRNFFPKDNAISRIIGTLQFLSADTSTILRLFLLLRSISITDDDNFIIFAWKLSSEHFSINQFQYTLHISSLINSSSTITELTWTSSRGTRANARNTNKSSRSSKQRKCGQGRNSHRPLQKEEEEEEKNPLRSEFPPVPSNGNFSSPRAFSLPASAVFPREPRAISFPYIAYTIPSPPSRSSSSSNLSRGASPPPRPPFPFARRGGARARGNGARRRRRAGGVAPTSSANRPTDRPDRAFSSQPGQYQAGSRREGCSNPSIRNRRPRSSSPSPPCTTRIERNVQQHLARGCRRWERLRAAARRLDQVHLGSDGEKWGVRREPREPDRSRNKRMDVESRTVRE